MPAMLRRYVHAGLRRCMVVGDRHVDYFHSSAKSFGLRGCDLSSGFLQGRDCRVWQPRARNYKDDWGERYQGLLVKNADGTDNYEIEANQKFAKDLEGKVGFTS